MEELAVEIQNRRYARIALERLFASGVLTEVQKRRFRLHVFRGLSTRQIGRLEGTSHQAVAKSLNLAIGKLKNFLQSRVDTPTVSGRWVKGVLSELSLSPVP